MTWQSRFDSLLKAMASGEPPKGGKESEGHAVTKNRVAKEEKRRPNA